MNLDSLLSMKITVPIIIYIREIMKSKHSRGSANSTLWRNPKRDKNGF